jgi:hypothetical protein
MVMAMAGNPDSNFAVNTPVVDNDDAVSIKDFTVKRKRIAFRVDNDVFEAYAVLGLPLLQDLMETSKTLQTMLKEQNFEALFTLFDKLLFPDSAKRFRERAMATGDDAIGVQTQLVPILHFLLEEYGLRPTQPSSESSAGSPSGTDGTTSTAGSSQLDSSSTT